MVSAVNNSRRPGARGTTRRGKALTLGGIASARRQGYRVIIRRRPGARQARFDTVSAGVVYLGTAMTPVAAQRRD